MKKTKLLKPRKQKELIIKKIGIEYRKVIFSNFNLPVINEDEYCYLERKKEDNYYEELKTKVDFILSQLEDSLSKMIYNEFFTVKDSTWWVYYYSRSTYYRIKNKAVDCFLEWWYA